MPDPTPAARPMGHTPFDGPLSVRTDTALAIASGFEPSGWADVVMNDRTIAGFYMGSEEENVARAEYAVRATNSHADLLAALELTASMLEATAVLLRAWGHEPSVNIEHGLDQARAALSRAKGEGR